MPSPTPDDVRVAVDRALARLAPEVAAEAPRALAVALALAEGIDAEAALARCGVEVPPASASPVPFVLLPPGALFWWQGARFRKVPARASRSLVPGAPNAYPVAGGDGRWIAPDQRVDRVTTGRRAA
ncbi:hypothetical protein [Rubrivirga sp.]|uniref:hypothetical protein n=1 Tax=Rubrivirga sp. TaxID=1885344 RepID=UPI003B52684D